MTIPHPRRPEPLPGKWLGQRSARESRWEQNDRAGEEKLREVQAWAKEALVNIFLAQDLGGDHKDPQFVARIDDLYQAIRNSLTRQDLIMGFLLVVQKDAQKEAADRMTDFNQELNRLTGGDKI